MCSSISHSFFYAPQPKKRKMEEEKQVLSIQSSVVYGYVGNKSATFPLQLHGYDVSPINSVQFSNHTGYGKFLGQVLNADEGSALFEGLRQNDLMNYSHVLTGYIGSDSFLLKVGEVVTEMKNRNANLTYVCDPVMGDNGRLYVSDKLIPVYRDVIVQLADVLTPNQFELEILTECTITSEQEAFKAIGNLHNKGVSTVVLSSSDLGDKDTLLCLASHREKGMTQKYRLKIPKLDSIFVGTGDLFASSLLTWLDKDKDLKSALEKTVCVVQAVVARTFKHAKRLAGPDEKPTMAQIELRLIQSRADIENPQVVLKAEQVNSE